MGKLIRNSWALFLGYGVLTVAHGLQGNLLGVRAVLENFNIIEFNPKLNPPSNFFLKKIESIMC